MLLEEDRQKTEKIRKLQLMLDLIQAGNRLCKEHL